MFLAAFASSIMFLLLFYRKESEEKEIRTNPIKKNDSGVLLLLPRILGNNDKSFSSQNWSCAWINTLEQEVGYFSALYDDSCSKNDLMVRKFVIVSKECRWSRKLETYVKNGGILLIEKPKMEVFGIKIKRRDLKAHAITYPKIDMLINTRIDEIEWKGSAIKLAIDNLPAILLKNIGKGHVILLTFDYGLQLVSLQQGVPSEDFSVKHKYGLIGIVEPADMVVNKKQLSNPVPFADVLEKYLFDIISKLAIIPRWWYLPYESNSGLILSHDEDYYGERSLELLYEEIKQNVPSTFFVNSPNFISDKLHTYLNENKIEIGFHWDKIPSELFSKKSGQKEFASQFEAFKRHDVLSSRIHFLKWSNYYTNPFRIMCKNNIKVDSSYGVNFGKGYVLCTSNFFHPIDTNGILMPILELPFQIMDKRGNADSFYIEKLLKGNNEKYHGILCFNFHPSKFKHTRKMINKTIDSAKKHKILFMNVKSYYDFYIGKINSSIKHIENDIIVHAKTDLGLMLPDHLSVIKVDNIKPKMRKINNYHIVKINKGLHKITVK